MGGGSAREPRTPLPLIGAHMSIAGGLGQALIRGRKLRCEAIQIFVKSTVRWRMPPLRPDEARRFGEARRESGVGIVFAHSSYLINLASSDPLLRKRSIASLEEEVRRSSALGLPFIVLHPGAHGGAGEREGIRKIADGLDEALAPVPGEGVKILLETTAGQGTSVGGRFEHLAEIIAASSRPGRLGVCFDTCHVFAAGYDLRSRKGYARAMEEFDRAVGLPGLKAFHLNDCRGPLGSHLDRHTHIGKGRLGLIPFSFLLNDRRFAGLPMVLETPKGRGAALDRRNLAVLRGLIRGRTAS
ncbi:MAG: deoxyribonuclease IV [Chlamydiota bacterium]